LGVQIGKSDVANVKMLVKPNGDHIPPIKVTFKGHLLAREIIENRSKLRGTRTFITGSLTKRRQAILQASKDVFETRNAWPSQGRVFLKIGENVMLVQNLAQLLSLPRSFVVPGGNITG
ncbi:hypothetical protein QYM36_003284, partial [Artemia franciscana]